MRTRLSLCVSTANWTLAGMCKWLTRAFRQFGIPHSRAKQCSVLYVRSRLVEKNPALLASTDSTMGDYSIFRDALVLTEAPEYIRVIIKGQEFWLPKSMVREDEP